MNSTIIYLIRHGQSLANLRYEFEGWNDSHLSEIGIKQAEKLHNQLSKNYTNVISSSSTRAIQTMEFALNKKKEEIESLIILDNLREGSAGIFENKDSRNLSDYEKSERKILMENYDYTVEGGESINTFNKRVIKTWNENIITKTNQNGNILVFTHGGWIKSLLSQIFEPERNYSILNCSITKISYEEGNYKLKEIKNMKFG